MPTVPAECYYAITTSGPLHSSVETNYSLATLLLSWSSTSGGDAPWGAHADYSSNKVEAHNIHGFLEIMARVLHHCRNSGIASEDGIHFTGYFASGV